VIDSRLVMMGYARLNPITSRTLRAVLVMGLFCTAVGYSAPFAKHKAKDAPAQATPPAAETTFVIGPADVLFIRVMHEPELSGRQDVGPDGTISLSLAGSIKATGLTAVQLGDAIREKLKSDLRNPEVSVEVVQVNSQKFILQGEVRRPGTYTFGSPVTVLEALAEGQGFTDWANLKKIYILRKGERLKFDYKAVSHGKQPEENVVVQNGDQIFVP
jgi:polysaccharide export outer membrane protein